MEPKTGEFCIARLERKDEFDKFAVRKCDVVDGNISNRHLSFLIFGRFAKAISVFLSRSNENSCKVEVIGKSEPWKWGRTPNAL